MAKRMKGELADELSAARHKLATRTHWLIDIFGVEVSPPQHHEQQQRQLIATMQHTCDAIDALLSRGVAEQRHKVSNA